MAHLGFLHDYDSGALLVSSNWNDEINQILYALGYEIVNADTFGIMLSGSSDDVNDAILRLNNLLAGNLLELGNGTLSSLLTANGQLQLGASAIVGLQVASIVMCTNLNADQLNSLDSTAFELDLYGIQGFFKFFTAPVVGVDNESWLVPLNSSAIITKFKAKQEGVASADASTIFTIKKNGSSLGTISIAGNTTAVQTNDIADVPLTSGDILTVEPTTYSGTTKHTNITVGFHYKQRFYTT